MEGLEKWKGEGGDAAAMRKEKKWIDADRYINIVKLIYIYKSNYDN